MTRERLQTSVMVLLAALLGTFLLLPFVSLFFQVTPAEWLRAMKDPQLFSALKLSVMTSLVSTVLVVTLGSPCAWLLANRPNRFKRTLESALKLPIVVPPAVAGLALLWTFGQKGILFSLTQTSFAFTTWAVVMAQVFVSAPFFLQAATAAFRRLDPEWIWVARSLGASPFRVFWKVALPISAPALLSGALVSWARALGEFGATLLFAGNLEGSTQTLPLAIYSAMESDVKIAQALALLLLALAFVVLVGIRFLEPREEPTS